MCDALTKWVEAFAIPKRKMEYTANAMLQIFARYPQIKTVIHDGGPEFTSSEFKRVCTAFGAKTHKTTTRHPQSNGQAEAKIKLVKTEVERLTQYVVGASNIPIRAHTPKILDPPAKAEKGSTKISAHWDELPLAIAFV